MPITFAQATRDLAAHVGKLIEGTVAASPGPTTKMLADPALEDKIRFIDLRDTYLRISNGPAVGQVRRIAAYQLDTGAVTVTRDFSATPQPGNKFEIYLGIHPDDFKARINDALTNLYNTEEIALAANGTQDWIVRGTGAVLNGINHPNEIIDVYHETSTTNAKQRVYLWWKALVTASTIVIRIYPVYNTGSIIFKVLRYYPALNNDDDTTDVDPKLLLHGSAVEYWRWLQHPTRRATRSADETQEIERQYAKSLAEFIGHTTKLPAIVRRHQLPSPFILPV